MDECHQQLEEETQVPTVPTSTFDDPPNAAAFCCRGGKETGSLVHTSSCTKKTKISDVFDVFRIWSHRDMVRLSQYFEVKFVE